MLRLTTWRRPLMGGTKHPKSFTSIRAMKISILKMISLSWNMINYHFSMPNKVFECIIRSIITKYAPSQKTWVNVIGSSIKVLSIWKFGSGLEKENCTPSQGRSDGGHKGARAPQYQIWGAQIALCPPPIKWKYGYIGVFSGAEGAGKIFLPLSTRYNGHFWKMCAPSILLTRSALSLGTSWHF